jgi:hypothetical protein
VCHIHFSFDLELTPIDPEQALMTQGCKQYWVDCCLQAPISLLLELEQSDWSIDLIGRELIEHFQ